MREFYLSSCAHRDSMYMLRQIAEALVQTVFFDRSMNRQYSEGYRCVTSRYLSHKDISMSLSFLPLQPLSSLKSSTYSSWVEKSMADIRTVCARYDAKSNRFTDSV